MTKQQIIEKAYGIFYELVKDYLDEDGWLNVDDFYLISQAGYKFTQIQTKEDTLTFAYHRPISLKNIESNNNWLTINSEAERIQEVDVWVCNLKGNKPVFFCESFKKIPRKYTHYQPVQKPTEKPIY